MKVISVEEFLERWNSTISMLGCPKLKGQWLYPVPEDPCKSGACGWIHSHNYRRGFREQDKLKVPEKPLQHLLKEHLKRWKEECKSEYEEIKFWAKVRGIKTVFDKFRLEEVDPDAMSEMR